MRKIFFAFLILSASVSYGAWNDQDLFNSASFTATNDNIQYVPLTYPGTVLRGVIISSAANVRVRIWDSSGAASNQIADLGNHTATPLSSYYIPFEVRLSSGLTYKTEGNSLGFTIIYKKVRP